MGFLDRFAFVTATATTTATRTATLDGRCCIVAPRFCIVVSMRAVIHAFDAGILDAFRAHAARFAVFERVPRSVRPDTYDKHGTVGIQLAQRAIHGDCLHLGVHAVQARISQRVPRVIIAFGHDLPGCMIHDDATVPVIFQIGRARQVPRSTDVLFEFLIVAVARTIQERWWMWWHS